MVRYNHLQLSELVKLAKVSEIKRRRERGVNVSAGGCMIGNNTGELYYAC